MFRKLCIVLISFLFIVACSTTKTAENNEQKVEYEIVEAEPQKEEIIAEPKATPTPSAVEHPAAIETKKSVDSVSTISKSDNKTESVAKPIEEKPREVDVKKTEAQETPIVKVPLAEEVKSSSSEVFEISNEANEAAPKNINIGEDVITKDALSDVALNLMGCFIVIIVLFTVSVAIRSANKIMLPKGIALLIAIVFTGLPILISYRVVGPSKYWFTYLILLSTYFIFRAKDRVSHFE